MAKNPILFFMGNSFLEKSFAAIEDEGTFEQSSNFIQRAPPLYLRSVSYAPITRYFHFMKKSPYYQWAIKCFGQVKKVKIFSTFS